MLAIKGILIGGAGLAALGIAAPAASQYYQQGYGNTANITQVAAQRCAAAVQNRLSSRNTGLLGIFGANNRSGGRVLSVTRAVPRRNGVMVRGLASSDAYGPYGMGAYGALGYQPPADLTFRCNVDYRGYVRDVDIMRR